MYEFILSFHSVLAYFLLAFLVFTIINALTGWSSKREFFPKDRKLALFALILTHIQFVAALLLYFTSPKGFALISELGMGEVMKNAALRLTVVEHPFTNILAVILITVGWSKHKKLAAAASKFKTFAIFYGLGLLMLLSRIPWDNWF